MPNKAERLAICGFLFTREKVKSKHRPRNGKTSFYKGEATQV